MKKVLQTDEPVDPNDPQVQEAALKQVEKQLREQGVHRGSRLRRRKQPDGKVFNRTDASVHSNKLRFTVDLRLHVNRNQDPFFPETSESGVDLGVFTHGPECERVGRGGEADAGTSRAGPSFVSVSLALGEAVPL